MCESSYNLYDTKLPYMDCINVREGEFDKYKSQESVDLKGAI